MSEIPSPPSAGSRPGRLGVGIISAGRVGAVLGSALRAVDHQVIGVHAVSEASRERAEALLPGVPVLDVEEIVERAELVMLAVPDDALATLVKGLADLGRWQPGQLVVHTSGRYGIGILEPARRLGAIPLALHPAMTFGGFSTDVARLTGCPMAVTAPDAVLPSNGLPEEPHAVLPPGRKIQVAKEDEHMDVLRDYVLRGSEADNHVAATLRSINEIRPRSSYEAVQVEIDGRRVGVLTKLQSDKLLPLVKHIEQRGLLPVVRAAVKGTRLKADVVLDCVDAQTVEDDWLDDLGEAVTDANVDKTPAAQARPDFDWDDEED